MLFLHVPPVFIHIPYLLGSFPSLPFFLSLSLSLYQTATQQRKQKQQQRQKSLWDYYTGKLDMLRPAHVATLLAGACLCTPLCNLPAAGAVPSVVAGVSG